MSKRLWALILLQILILLSIVGKYYWIAETGALVTIKTAPVDPRDLFYGDYVTLNYEITTIEKSSVAHDLPDEYLYGKNVFVVLEKKGNPWHEAVGVYLKKPSLTENQVMLRGALTYSDENNVYINYGFDRYYVPENTGKEIEEERDKLQVVDLRVSGGGEAVIVALRK